MRRTSEGQRVRLKFCADIEMGQSPPSGEYSSSPDEGLAFLQGTADFGAAHPTPRVFSSSPSKIARAGDLLLSVRAPVGELNVADQDYGIGRGLCAIRPRDGWDKRYAWWALHEARHQLSYVSKGSTYDAVTIEDVANLRVEVADEGVQPAIAKYLDRETAQIDQLISVKEQVLELLTEKRGALVADAVTSGLDASAPRRYSGIDWLGKIPAHWGVKRGKWLFQEKDERSVHGEETLLSLRMERGLVPHNEVSEKQTRPNELVGYKHVSPGDLVVNRMRASIGLIAIAPLEGLVSPDYAVFVANPGTHVDYYGHLFTTELLGSVFRSVSRGMGTGTQGFLRLYSESFLALWYPSPSVGEQRAIVSYIEQENAGLAKSREVAERTISLLKERRAALIAAAVTGQIEVGAAA